MAVRKKKTATSRKKTTTARKSTTTRRTTARKGKVGRPKGVRQSEATKKKIAAALRAYWKGAGKSRKKKTTAKKPTGRKPGRPKGSGKRTVRAKLHYRTRRKSYSVGKRARKSTGKRPVAKRRPMA